LNQKEDDMSADDTSFEVLLRSEQSGEVLSQVRITVPGGWAGPPLHHHDFDETFYVLEGELTFQLGEQLTTARPGECVFAARGSHHTLANLGATRAQYLLTCTPAGFERYFDRLQAELTGRPAPPEAAGSFPETTVVGPQIGARP
jgi:mannose-6-phosphate isomerase-like protein (cupin superfamily)